MKKAGSRDRFFHTTRGRIVLDLMDAPRTVSELAAKLDLTDNAVRSHLVTLERDGVIRQSGERRSGGRPAFVYEVTPEADELVPRAYDRALGLVLGALDDRMTAQELDDLLFEAGRRSVEEPPGPDASVAERLELAVEAVRRLGGLAEVEHEEGGVVRLRTKSCPLSAVLKDRPGVCRLVEGALEAVLGAPVESRCDVEGRPVCTFEAVLPEAVGT